jgi:glycosyltransferase involved in cell wall biosynthesis
MENPKVSLIIPAHNEEKNIETCLSYATKSSQNGFFEIIVINNASDDRTRAVAEKVLGVKVIDEPKKGLTVARQSGFEHATGDILAYVDADTRMPNGWLETIEKEFKNNPHLACLSGPYTYFDVSAWQKLLVWIYWHFLAFPMYLFVGYMTVGGNFAIRRNVVEKMGGFDTNISFYGEDTNIARRASQFGKVKFKLNLIMPTSGRRFHGEGFAGTAIEYMRNFLSEVFFHHPSTKEYEDIR